MVFGAFEKLLELFDHVRIFYFILLVSSPLGCGEKLDNVHLKSLETQRSLFLA